MRTRPIRRTLGVLAALSLVAAACGDDETAGDDPVTAEETGDMSEEDTSDMSEETGDMSDDTSGDVR